MINLKLKRLNTAAMTDEIDEWVTVPREPTQAMLEAAWAEDVSMSDAHTEHGVTLHVWDAMLAAAPKHGDNPERDAEATITLTAEGWVWDGDQWVLPEAEPRELSDADINAIVSECYGEDRTCTCTDQEFAYLILAAARRAK